MHPACVPARGVQQVEGLGGLVDHREHAAAGNRLREPAAERYFPPGFQLLIQPGLHAVRSAHVRSEGRPGVLRDGPVRLLEGSEGGTFQESPGLILPNRSGRRTFRHRVETLQAPGYGALAVGRGCVDQAVAGEHAVLAGAPEPIVGDGVRGAEGQELRAVPRTDDEIAAGLGAVTSSVGHVELELSRDRHGFLKLAACGVESAQVVHPDRTPVVEEVGPVHRVLDLRLRIPQGFPGPPVIRV